MSEKIYDEQIAPLLLKAGKIAEANGMSIAALVEYAPGEFGRTVTLSKGSHFSIRLVDVAIKAKGNVDSLYMALARHGKEVGHSSMVLELLGVPASSPSAASHADNTEGK